MKNSSPFYVYLLIGGIFIRLFTIFYVPMFYAPDEEPHFKYIQYIAENKSLPIAYSMTNSETKDWEFYQPPLYYILSSLLTAKSEWLSFYLYRIFSVILFCITFIFSEKILRRLSMGNFQKSVVLAFISFLPTYIFISSAVNNDNLLITISVITFYILINSNFNKLKALLTISLWIALAILTKYSSLIIVFFVAAYFLIQYFKKKNLKFLVQLFLIAIFSGIFTSVFFVRNLVLHESLYGFANVHKIGKDWESFPKALGFIINTLVWTFYAVAGIVNDLRPTMYPFSYLLFAGAIFGAILILRKSRNTFLLLAVVTVFFNVLLIIYFGYNYHQAQGRFLFPSLLFFAIMFSFGYVSISEKLLINKKISVIILLIFFILGYGFTILKFENHKAQDLAIVSEQPFNAKKSLSGLERL